MKSIEIAALAFQRDQSVLAAIGQNLANINSTGYRRQIPVQLGIQSSFAPHWAGAVSQSDSQFANSPTAEPVLALIPDPSAGKVSLTQQPLDIALSAQDYLQVALPSGATGLSRGGALRLDESRRLCTSDGLRILDRKGGDIALPTGAQSISIDAAGNVLADGQAVAGLGVVRVSQESRLKSLGQGLWDVISGPPAKAVETATLRVGALEASNVMASQEMVNLMATARHAEALAKIIQGSDELLEKAIRRLGDLA